MPAAIVHFGIQVSDTERAKRFYHDVFDWKVEKWEGTDYYGIWTGRSKYPDGSVVGMDGGLGAKEGKIPPSGSAANAFVCTIEIENIDETLEKVEMAGGTIVKPKFDFPGAGWMATCTDPDDNQFALVQSNPQKPTRPSST